MDITALHHCTTERGRAERGEGSAINGAVVWHGALGGHLFICMAINHCNIAKKV